MRECTSCMASFNIDLDILQKNEKEQKMHYNAVIEQKNCVCCRSTGNGRRELRPDGKLDIS